MVLKKPLTDSIFIFFNKNYQKLFPKASKLSSIRRTNSNVLWANLTTTGYCINGRDEFTFILFSCRNFAYLRKNTKVTQSDRS